LEEGEVEGRRFVERERLERRAIDKSQVRSKTTIGEGPN
jgi:hypothetical protein